MRGSNRSIRDPGADGFVDAVNPLIVYQQLLIMHHIYGFNIHNYIEGILLHLPSEDCSRSQKSDYTPHT